MFQEQTKIVLSWGRSFNKIESTWSSQKLYSIFYLLPKDDKKNAILYEGKHYVNSEITSYLLITLKSYLRNTHEEEDMYLWTQEIDFWKVLSP